MKVTFLGVGAMGYGIAANIASHGLDLTVWNRHIERALPLQEKGAKICADLAEAVRDADVIGMCVIADPEVKELCAAIYPHVKSGAVVFDCTTASPGCSQEMEKLFAEKGVAFLDSPVSGGRAGAEAGTLAVMVGGDKAAFEKAKPVFETFSGCLEHMGPSGAGESTKLINQILTAANQTAVCEAMMLAERVGLDLNQLYGLLRTAWGSSRMLERSVEPYIIPKNYDSASCLYLMAKDLRLALKMAEDAECDLAVTRTSHHYFQSAEDAGWGKQDMAAIIKIMEQENEK